MDLMNQNGGGSGLRELLGKIRDEKWILYDEGDGLRLQKMHLPPSPVNDGLRVHAELFQALLKYDSELTADERQIILENDVRWGFTPPGDWRGAARALRELGNISNV